MLFMPCRRAVAIFFIIYSPPGNKFVIVSTYLPFIIITSRTTIIFCQIRVLFLFSVLLWIGSYCRSYSGGGRIFTEQVRLLSAGWVVVVVETSSGRRLNSGIVRASSSCAGNKLQCGNLYQYLMRALSCRGAPPGKNECIFNVASCGRGAWWSSRLDPGPP